MNLYRLTFVLLIFTFGNIWAQKPKEERYEKKDNVELMEYDREFTYGINWNTNSALLGGFSFKYGWQHKKIQTQYHIVCLEFVDVKHKRELPIGRSGFVIGKEYLFYAIRPSYGREILLFNKAEEEGVQVSWIIAGGPSFGFRKPIYVNYIYPRTVGNTTVNDIRAIPYKADSSIDRIDSPASYFLGFDNLSTHLGAHIRTSLNFEFGHFRNSIAGLEVGGMFEAYSERIIMIPTVENNWFFPTMFFILYLGVR